jgi:multiple sugar transport system substrate-binding protein
MKKQFLFIIPFAVASLLAGCSTTAVSSPAASSAPASSAPASSAPAPTSSSSSSSSVPSAFPKDADGHFIHEPTTITFWNTSSYDSQIQAIIDAFKTVEPNVTVTNVKESASYDGLKDKIIQGIPADNYPDMFLGYPDAVQEIMGYNKVVQLDRYMNDSDAGWTAEDKADIVSNYLTEGQSYPVEGTWSLPLAKSTEAMYYNQKVLIGLDLSSIDATINSGKAIDADYLNSLTWEELFGKLCPAIKTYNDGLAADKKILYSDYDYHAIFGYDSDDNMFITLAQQYGYGYTSVNATTGVGSVDFVNDGMKGLMKTFNAAKNKGYLMTKGTAGNYTNYAFTRTKPNSLFSIGSTGGIKFQVAKDFDVGVAKIPHAKDHDPYVINQGPSVAVLNHDDANRSLASWLFYRFFTNKENSLAWALNTGYSPIRYSNFEDQKYLDYMNPTGKTAMSLEKLTAEVATYTATVNNDLYISPVFKGSATARTQAGSLTTQILNLSVAECTDAKVNELFSTAYDNVLAKM